MFAYSVGTSRCRGSSKHCRPLRWSAIIGSVSTGAASHQEVIIAEGAVGGSEVQPRALVANIPASLRLSVAILVGCAVPGAPDHVHLHAQAASGCTTQNRDSDGKELPGSLALAQLGRGLLAATVQGSCGVKAVIAHLKP